MSFERFPYEQEKKDIKNLIEHIDVYRDIIDVLNKAIGKGEYYIGSELNITSLISLAQNEINNLKVMIYDIKEKIGEL